MNKQVLILLIVIFATSAVSAGPYYPFYKPFAGLRSYYYTGAPVAAPLVAPYTSPYASAYLGDYYSYAAANALAYPYSYPYVGGYSAYPYLKK